MESVILKAKVYNIDTSDIDFEFGRVQASMDISSKGKAAKTLKLKEDDKVEITIKKI